VLWPLIRELRETRDSLCREIAGEVFDRLHRANVGLLFSGPEVPDLECMEVEDVVRWAEEVMRSPGVVRGERRRALGIDLIRRGVQVLRGRFPIRQGNEKLLKAYVPIGDE